MADTETRKKPQFAGIPSIYLAFLPRFAKIFIKERRIMATLYNLEERLWRTDLRKGRNIYVLLSNDSARPSEDDPLIGVMESSIVAENIVNTHNGVLALYGRRYPQILATSEIESAVDLKSEVYFKVNRAEYDQLLAIAGWLHKGPLPSTPVVEKLFRALGGEDDR